MKEDKLLYYKVFGPSSLSQKRDAHITKILDFYQTNRKQLNFTFQNIMNKATGKRRNFTAKTMVTHPPGFYIAKCKCNVLTPKHKFGNFS